MNMEPKWGLTMEEKWLSFSYFYTYAFSVSKQRLITCRNRGEGWTFQLGAPLACVVLTTQLSWWNWASAIPGNNSYLGCNTTLVWTLSTNHHYFHSLFNHVFNRVTYYLWAMTCTHSYIESLINGTRSSTQWVCFAYNKQGCIASVDCMISYPLFGLWSSSHLELQMCCLSLYH